MLQYLPKRTIVTVLVIAAIYWYLQWTDKPLGEVWVVNPGKTAATVTIGDKTIKAAPGAIGSGFVTIGKYEAKIERGGEAETLPLEVFTTGREVALVDLEPGDRGYAVVDLAPYYEGGRGKVGALPLRWTSNPARVHRMPFNGVFVLKPGQPLPEVNTTFKGAKGPTQLKLFRVAADRLADEKKLAADLSATVAKGELKAPAARAAAAPKTATAPEPAAN